MANQYNYNYMARRNPENWHTTGNGQELGGYQYTNPYNGSTQTATVEQYKNLMGIGNGGGVVNQDVVLINVLAETQRNKNAFVILAENKRVDIAIVAIADNPLKIRTIYFAQYLAIYFA